MATPNQLSTAQLSNNLLFNRLNKDDNSATVYDYSGGFNVLDFLTTRVSKSREIKGANGEFSVPILGNNAVVAQVASTSTVGSNLRVNFTDTSYNAFRNQIVVNDGTAANNQGRIIDKGPGFVLLEPIGTSTFNTSTMFLPGSFTTALFSASGNFGSTGLESLYENPIYVKNQTSITRDSAQIFRRDTNQTWAQFEGDFWWSAQEPLMMQRFAKNLELKALFSKYATTTNSTIGGSVNYSMGLRDAIRDPQRGGIYQPLSSAMTQGDFESFIGRIADRQAAAKVDITLVVGRGFLRWVQSFVSPYIQFGGKQNTFGGEGVMGIDVDKYSVAGINVNLIMHPLFNDEYLFPTTTSISTLSQFRRMQYTAYALDLGMIDGVGTGMLPAMEKCYFGPKEIEYDYFRGIGMNQLTSNKAPNSLPAVTDRDSMSLEVYSDCAYNFMPYRMGLIELVV